MSIEITLTVINCIEKPIKFQVAIQFCFSISYIHINMNIIQKKHKEKI